LLELGGDREAPERVVPHALEHLTDRAERVAPRAIEAVASVATNVDESVVEQLAQLQRHGAERDVWHGAMDVAGSLLGGPDEPEDLATARRGDNAEEGVRFEHEYTLA
jgi:hypothetical protein